MEHGPFDVVLSNPPYVPVDGEGKDPRWDAGPDGRSVLDPLCDSLPTLLSPDGFALLVHSEFTGVEETLERVQAAGLAGSVVARERIPFGPGPQRRLSYLQEVELAERGVDSEEVVVIRAARI